MKKYPIWQNGEKLITEDVNAAALVAGTADDAVHASMTKIPVEGTERRGWVRPWREGPIVLPSSSDGKVKVQPFTMFMSPGGATSNAGAEDASGGSETTANLKSARYEGGTATVATPLPTAGNMRWDLLYATISEADSDAASRLIATVSGSTKVVATSTVNTRHGSSVTLAWVQGTASPTGTDPYPSGSMPALPVASAGTANVPLAYVQVQNSGTPGTVQYTVDRIAGCERIARLNPQAGASPSAAGIAAGKVSLSGAFTSDPASIITTASAQGGWAPTGTSIRPVRFMEPVSGGIDLWIPIGPFSTTAGNKTFGATFGGSPKILIATPTVGHVMHDDKPWDWSDRWFHADLLSGAFKHSWDMSVAAGPSTTSIMPSTSPTSSAVKRESWGNSIRCDTNFDTAIGASDSYFVAAYFADVGGYGAADDIALIVEKGSGILYLVAREATANAVNGVTGMIHLRASGKTPHLGL